MPEGTQLQVRVTCRERRARAPPRRTSRPRMTSREPSERARSSQPCSTPGATSRSRRSARANQPRAAASLLRTRARTRAREPQRDPSGPAELANAPEPGVCALPTDDRFTPLAKPPQRTAESVERFRRFLGANCLFERTPRVRPAADSERSITAGERPCPLARSSPPHRGTGARQARGHSARDKLPVSVRDRRAGIHAAIAATRRSGYLRHPLRGTGVVVCNLRRGAKARA